MRRFEAKIVIEEVENGDILGCVETENRIAKRYFEFGGFPETAEEIHDWLLGQVARTLDIENILKRV